MLASVAGLSASVAGLTVAVVRRSVAAYRLRVRAAILPVQSPDRNVRRRPNDLFLDNWREQTSRATAMVVLIHLH